MMAATTAVASRLTLTAQFSYALTIVLVLSLLSLSHLFDCIHFSCRLCCFYCSCARICAVHLPSPPPPPPPPPPTAYRKIVIVIVTNVVVLSSRSVMATAESLVEL